MSDYELVFPCTCAGIPEAMAIWYSLPGRRGELQIEHLATTETRRASEGPSRSLPEWISQGNCRRAGFVPPTRAYFAPDICGALAGGLVFLIILLLYCAGLFVERASVKLIGDHLFKTFSIGGGKVYDTRSNMENICSWYNAPRSSE